MWPNARRNFKRPLPSCRRTSSRVEQLVSEKSVLSGQLEARKIVERAMGILQREMKINEEDAYRMIQKQSQQMRKSMKENCGDHYFER